MRLCLFERYARLQSGNEFAAVAGVPELGSAVLRGRCQRDVDAGLGRQESKSGRQHANDSARHAIQPNLPANRVWIGVKALPPVGIGEDRDAVGLESHFALGECPPQDRSGAQGSEEFRRYLSDLLALSRARLAHDRGAISQHGEGAESGDAASALVVVRRRGAIAHHFHLRVSLVQNRQPAGIGKRQRAQQYRIDDGEDRQVGAQA